MAPKAAKSGPFGGRILVSYPVGTSDYVRVNNALEKLFLLEAKTDDRRPLLWESPIVRWTERNPKKRLDLFKQNLGGNWQNPDQEPILRSMVSEVRVEFHEGDLLPFRLLIVEFGIVLSKDDKAWNHPKNLIFLAQKCRDLMDDLLDHPGRGRGENVVVTSEFVASSTLETLRDDVRHLARSATVWRNSVKDRTGLLRTGPPGYHPAEAGFSHMLVSRNLHAVLAPLAGTDRAGPGWVVHFYEEAVLEGSRNWESGALQLVDPVGRSRFTGYVENRVTGLPLLLALSAWTNREDHESREQRKALMSDERRLRKWLIWPGMWFAWSRLYRRSRDARVRVQELRAIRDEYENAMQSFLSDLKEDETVREVWVPTEGFDEVAPENRRSKGPLFRLVAEILKDFRASDEFAIATHEQARGQLEFLKVRVERVLGIALLLFAFVETLQIMFQWIPPSTWMRLVGG